MKHYNTFNLLSTAPALIGFCLISTCQVVTAQSREAQLREQIRSTGMMNVVCTTCDNPLGQVAYNPLSAGQVDHIIQSHTLIKDHNTYRCAICKTPLFETSDLVSSAKGQLTFTGQVNLLKLKYETYHIELPLLAKRMCSFCRDAASQHEYYEPGIVLRLR